MPKSNDDFITSAQRTIAIEQQAISHLLNNLDNSFQQACELLIGCSGRIIVMGMGKSGHIAKKIAATLSSTGSPAFFVHPAEASHGDLGMIVEDDIVIAISYSGMSDEIISLIPTLRQFKCPLIAMTGNRESLLATSAQVVLSIAVPEEACSLGLAPTSSTTVSLVMGDAIAVALHEAKGFTAEDFALSHPSGSLGKRLLLKVGDVMRSGDKIPMVDKQSTLSETILEISSKGLGISTVIDADKNLCGVFTDGDLRRILEQQYDLSQTIEQLMSVSPRVIRADALAIEALTLMETARITSLIIIDEHNSQRVQGVVHLHDLLEIGL